MANIIKLKNSDTAGNVPASLEAGELAINRADEKLFYTDSSNTVKGIYLEGAETEYTTTEPSPPTEGIKLFTRLRTGKRYLAQKTPNAHAELQPHWATVRAAIIDVHWGTTGYSNIGGATPTGTGTASAATLTATPASKADETKRVIYTSAGTANSAAGARGTQSAFFRGASADYGGFYIAMEMALITTIPQAIIILGVRNSTTALAGNAAISSLTNVFAAVKETGDTTFHIYRKGASGGTKDDTGITPTSGKVYIFRAYCRPNDTVMYASIETVGEAPGVGTFYENSYTTDLPQNNVGLTWIMQAGNNATASAVATGFAGVYYETPS